MFQQRNSIYLHFFGIHFFCCLQPVATCPIMCLYPIHPPTLFYFLFADSAHLLRARVSFSFGQLFSQRQSRIKLWWALVFWHLWTVSSSWQPAMLVEKMGRKWVTWQPWVQFMGSTGSWRERFRITWVTLKMFQTLANVEFELVKLKSLLGSAVLIQGFPFGCFLPWRWFMCSDLLLLLGSCSKLFQRWNFFMT